MEFRISVPKDASEVAVVLRRSIEELCYEDHHDQQDILVPWLENKTPDNVAEWISNPENYCVTAIAGPEQVAGFGLMTNSGRILLLYVNPYYAGKGVGHGLLEALELQAKAWRLPKLSLDSTVTAKRFYENHGYVGMGSSASRRDGLLCHAMYKPLGT